MITALAQVVSVEPCSVGWRAQLHCEQQSSCSGCAQKSSCGTGIVSGAVGNKTLRWTLDTEQAVQVGDTVEIGLPERQLLSFAATVYLLPLLFLLLGAVMGQVWVQPLIGAGEGAIILAAVLFAFLGFVLAKWLVRRKERATSEQVILLRILGSQIPVV